MNVSDVIDYKVVFSHHQRNYLLVFFSYKVRGLHVSTTEMVIFRALHSLKITLCTVFMVAPCILKFINYTHQQMHLFIILWILKYTLKFTLKHLKRSYMFRSSDHPQGAYIVPCYSYILKQSVNYFVISTRWWGSMSCVVCMCVVPCAERYYAHTNTRHAAPSPGSYNEVIHWLF
jgi:hypothetical protein